MLSSILWATSLSPDLFCLFFFFFNLVSSFIAFKTSCALEKRGILETGEERTDERTESSMDFMLPFFEELNLGFIVAYFST